MENEVKRLEIPIEIKADKEEVGSFKAYVSVWNKIDRANEYTVKGCAEESIRKMNGKFPVLWNHEHSDLIGFSDVMEDEKGIFVDGLLSDNPSSPLSANALNMMRLAQKKGASLGLSIGYREINTEYDKDTESLRLNKIELIEVSLAPVQCLIEASVISVKNIEEVVEDITEIKKIEVKSDVNINVRTFEKHLSDLGFSNSESKRIASSAFNHRDDEELNSANEAYIKAIKSMENDK